MLESPPESSNCSITLEVRQGGDGLQAHCGLLLCAQEHTFDTGECAFLVAGDQSALWCHLLAYAVDITCVVKLRSLLGNFNDVRE